MWRQTLTGEELARLLLAVTGNRDKNVYVFDSGWEGKQRRVTGVTVEEISPASIVLETEEL